MYRNPEETAKELRASERMSDKRSKYGAGSAKAQAKRALGQIDPSLKRSKAPAVEQSPLDDINEYRIAMLENRQTMVDAVEDVLAETLADEVASSMPSDTSKPVRPKTPDDVVFDRTVLEKNGVDYKTVAIGLVESAEALGMDPVDLATIISYETGGTFDPTKKGPTTKWGQHRGFIQFGEPQAEEYGVDWDNPYESQLGAEGAIVKYFKASGFKEGMGLLDAYSIVNAGGPGRHNWSDEGAGGAKGTVADKVNKQMSGHRAKARRLLEDYT